MLGEARSGIFNLLVRHVFDTWIKYLTGYSCPRIGANILPSSSSVASPGLEEVSSVVASMKAHNNLIIKASVFGPVHKKNIRLVSTN